MVITAAVLSPSLDLGYEVEELEVGAIHRPSRVGRWAGGKGLNMVRAAHRLGAAAQAVPVLGGPVGDLVATLLAEEGIPVTVVPNAHETRICVSIAGTQGAGDAMTEVYQRATPLAEGVLAALEDALTRSLAGTGWLALNGGLPAGTDPGRVADMVARVRSRGVAVAVDCYGDLLRRLLDARVDLVKVNRVEAAGLVGVPAGAAELPRLAAELGRRSGTPVVVTDGAAGSVLHVDGRGWRVPVSARRGRYAVGSGDSYLGGLLAGLEEGRRLPDAVRLGAGAATANALLPGPGHLDPAVARQVAEGLELQAL